MWPGVAAWRRGRDFLRGHHERQRNFHVQASGADRAHALAESHQLAKRVGQAILDPVSDNHAGAQRGAGKELLRRGQGGAH